MIEAVVPMYNEEDGCVPLARAIYSALAATGQDFVVRFMIGGTDDTYGRLLDYILNEKVDVEKVELVFDGERGLGTAIRHGLGLVSDEAEWVLTMDGDGQCVPEQISRFWDVARLPGHWDAIAGYQDPREDSRGRMRRMKSWLATRTLKLRYGMRVRSITLNYRLYSGRAIRSARRFLVSRDFAIQPEIMVTLARLGFNNVASIPVSWPEREHGKSKAQLSALEYLRLLL